MRRTVFIFATALTLASSGALVAQSSFSGGGGFSGGGSGGSSFGGGGGGGSSFGGGGGSSFAGGTSFSGGTSFTGGSMSGGTSFSGTSFSGGTGMAGGQSYPTGGGIRGGAGGTGFTASATNFMNATATNPLWPGRPGSTNISNKTPGGFGQMTLPATTTGGTTATGGRTGTATINRGGMNGYNSTGQMGAPISPITYALEVRFAAPPVATSRVQADLQALINRTSQLTRPANVSVEMNGNVVILRGRVANDDERRLVEAMVRLEPGVHDVQNEIEIPRPRKP